NHLTLQFLDRGAVDSTITIRNTSMPTTVTGGAGRDVLTVDRTTDPTPHGHVVLASSAPTRPGTEANDYTPVPPPPVHPRRSPAASTTINTGPADDPVTVLATGLLGATTINSADGKHDTLTVVLYGIPLAAGSGAGNLQNLSFAVGSLVIDNTKQADGTSNPV